MIHVQKRRSFVLAFLSSTVPVKCRCIAVPLKYALYLKHCEINHKSLTVSFQRLQTEVQALDADNTFVNNHSSPCFSNAHIFTCGILLFK